MIPSLASHRIVRAELEARVPDLLVDKQDRFTVLTINRPERMNSLGGTVMADLTAGMKEFQGGPAQTGRHHHRGGRARRSPPAADLKEMAAKGAAAGAGRCRCRGTPTSGAWRPARSR